MCGIVGIIGKTQVNQTIYDALTVLQHRGQDAAGIVTVEQDRFRLRKANGLVKDVFQFKHMQRLQGIHGIGHVRYPTAGSSSASEAQPFYVNSPYGMTLAHNGNITNVEQIRTKLANQAKRHLNTTSDSELLLNILANELDHTHSLNLVPKDIFNAISALHQQVSGGYAVVSLLINHGLIAFRDPHGIRPLCLGSRTFDGVTEYMLASESVALDACGFEFKRDVLPGEGIYITFDGQFHSHQCAEFQQLTPCIFEYVYFARPDSFIDEVSVYAARVNMGKMLGKKILKTWDLNEIDVVIPIPETSSDIALEISQVINKPYRQGFVKNRYVGRTFIMPGQQERKKSVRRKLNAIRSEFKGKSVLLVDDSIVRGTTSQQIISMARDVGAKKVYLASAAPEIRYPNVYGIDMPTSKELIAHGRNVDEIAQVIGADGLIYQDLEDLKIAIQTENQNLKCFECSVFDGKYVTNDITPTYLERLSQDRADESKNTEYSKPSINLEMYNEV